MKPSKRAKLLAYFSPRNTLMVMLIIIVTLLAVSIVTQWIVETGPFTLGSLQYDILQRFNVDQEVSVPTWYSQSALLFAAVLAVYIGVKTKRKGQERLHWFGLGGVLTYMSLDEGASLHELLFGPARDLIGIQDGVFVAAWVIPACVVAIIVSLLFLRFVLRLPNKTKTLIFLGAILFMLGAVVMEVVDAGLYTYFVEQAHNPASHYKIVTRSLEEGLEMLGVATIVYALFDYSRATFPSKTTRVHKK